MGIAQNSVELYDQFAKFSKSEIQQFCSLSNSGKWQNQKKLQDCAMVTATITIQSRYTILALTAMEHQRTGIKAIENPHTT
jgi:hypothetical protein